MELEFFPYDFTYKVEGDSTYVHCYSVTKEGKNICVVFEHTPSFYVVHNVDFEAKLRNLTLSLPQVAKVLRVETVQKELLGKKRKFFQVYANYPKAVPKLAKEIQSWGVACFERDILFIHRFLRDKSLLPMTSWVAQGEFENQTTFRATQIEQQNLDTYDNWNVLALDIETYAHKKEINTKKNPILMVALHGSTGYKKVITWQKKSDGPKYIEYVKDEKELLERLVEEIKNQAPHIITGYYTDGFDFPYIQDRADKHKVQLDFGFNNAPLTIRKAAGMRESEARINGILHLDVLKFVKYIFGKNMKTDSYSLDNVAGELLNARKHDVNLDELASSWDNNDTKKLLAFCKYNLQDAKLTLELCQMLLSDMIEFGKIVGVPVYDVIRMRFSRLVQNYIMKRAIEFNVLAPNKPDDQELSARMNESIKGAFVYEPTPGLYKDVVVFDFRSLYPTIITSHNLGPESFKQGSGKKNNVPEKEGWWFSQDKVFMPSVLEDLIRLRMDVKEQIKSADPKQVPFLEARSYAYKILANSFYGYLAFYGARWYSLESAAATTAFARHYIKQTIEKAREEGFEVVYGDTDSCFFALGKKNVNDALKFMESVNKDLPGLMELEFEGYFTRGLFVAIKGKEKGAKKKYALLRKDGSLKITGFETVRRNWSPLAKELQQEVLHLVLQERIEDALVYAKKVVNELATGKTKLDKLVMTTQLTRDLSAYKSIGPHVLVARKMVEKGQAVHAGMLIKYIICKGKGLIRDRAKLVDEVTKGEYDSDYYINNQILPAISSIFAVLGYSDEKLLGIAEQKGLAGFF